MKYDFDKVIDRKNTNSYKWSFSKQLKGVDALPLWLADMDFVVANKIIEAIQKIAAFGIYGYTKFTDTYFEPLIKWMKKRKY